MKSKEWKRYEKECKEFEKMIKQKEFHFSILCEMLKRNINEFPETWKKDPIGMAEIFKINMKIEIDKARSMDRPNVPGYYRANND